MNALLFNYMFPDYKIEPGLKSAQFKRLSAIMSDMLSAKLKREFPEYSFSAFTLEDADFGLSFHQN